MTNPIRTTDNMARALAQTLMQEARFAALATLTAQGLPTVTRVAFGLGPDGAPISLVSTLAAHTQALQENAACSLLIGEPANKGDPLTHPRLTLNGQAEILPNNDDHHHNMAEHYLRTHPKAKLYIGFRDFHFLKVAIGDAMLNGGFGKAFHLTPADLGL